MSDNKKEYAPINDSPTKLQMAKEQQKKDAVKFVKKLQSEPQVKIKGDPIYEQYLGKEYTFFYNHIPVSIRFDGGYYSYPQSIANHIIEKLAKISVSNTPKSVNEKLR